jgi:hypothetical protein
LLCPAEDTLKLERKWDKILAMPTHSRCLACNVEIDVMRKVGYCESCYKIHAPCRRKRTKNYGKEPLSCAGCGATLGWNNRHGWCGGCREKAPYRISRLR